MSPLPKYSMISLNNLCSISPVFLWRTMSLHSSRHLGGSVAILSAGRLNWNCESFRSVFKIYMRIQPIIRFFSDFVSHKFKIIFSLL